MTQPSRARRDAPHSYLRHGYASRLWHGYASRLWHGDRHATPRFVPLLLAAGIALAACNGATGHAKGGAEAGAQAGAGGSEASSGAQATDGVTAPELCSDRASWAETGVDPAELFPGTGTAKLSYPDATQVALGRELRCEVLRDAQGAVVGYAAGFSDSLPSIGQRAAVLVRSGYAGDGTYQAEGEGEAASVQLVVWIANEPCLPSGGCLSGTHPAQVTLQDGGHQGTASTAEGLQLEFECSAALDLAPVPGAAIDVTAPAPGMAYMERASGFVLPFVGIECSTDEVTGLLSVRTQPRPWSDPKAYDRGYGFSAAYLEPATTDPQRPLAVHMQYDYFGIVAFDTPINARLECGSPFAGGTEPNASSDDPNLVGAWFRCP